MANEYMSPGGFLALGEPSQTGAIGMLGGAMAGQNRDIGLNMIDRAFRDSDLSNLMAKEDYRQKTDDVDTKLKTNELQRMLANEDLTLTDPRTALKRSTMEQGVRDNQQKDFGQKLEQKRAIIQEAVAMDAAIGDSGTVPPHLMENLQDLAKRAGVPIVGEDAMQTRERLRQFSMMGKNYLDSQLKYKDLENRKEVATIGANAQRDVANLHSRDSAASDATRLKIAQMNAGNTPNEINGLLQAKYMKVGAQNMEETELNQLRSNILTTIAEKNVQSVAVKLMQLRADKIEGPAQLKELKAFTEGLAAIQGGQQWTDIESELARRKAQKGGAKTAPPPVAGAKAPEEAPPPPSDPAYDYKWDNVNKIWLRSPKQ